MKPGFKTTEFYVMLAAAVGAAAAALAGALPGQVGAALVAISGAAYALSRGLAKMNATGATDPEAILKLIEDAIKAKQPPTA